MRSGHLTPDLPPVWAMATIAASVLAAWLVPIARFGSAWSTGLGILLAVVGIAIMAWSALWFRRKKTEIMPRQTPTALIVEGPYRINRNPIYTGMALVVLGVAFWLGALSAVAIAMIYPFVITARFIRGEEAGLRQAFGFEAERYFARTRRW
ncbi:isoprenylcysteine carboxylmethyltransferase family protein [Aurantimonas aggregata]|uniref:Isoprenylcysteine carboxylmethyltransferase family protein n=1 Tax=Aurantimonas aggregata TaxID=2047720 RepID=A0A6L9MCM0_9HYPH|nr:isoprenylcysteine carboxylmethyltransferase family protein [Aurantimonas aggregata]NDV85564.1 isoprenylcysteine carboxylmethyltransferase family protein [Aurantimonas aggregata]